MGSSLGVEAKARLVVKPPGRRSPCLRISGLPPLACSRTCPGAQRRHSAGAKRTGRGCIEVPAALLPWAQSLAGTDLRRLRPPLFLGSGALFPNCASRERRCGPLFIASAAALSAMAGPQHL
jgi:hypothetical protein